MLTNTENIEQELTQLKKKLTDIALLAEELLETSVPDIDPLKETRYICASCFLKPLLKAVLGKENV